MQILGLVLGVTQIFVFLDTSMLVSPMQNCSVGSLSPHEDPTRIVLRRSGIISVVCLILAPGNTIDLQDIFNTSKIPETFSYPPLLPLAQDTKVLLSMSIILFSADATPSLLDSVLRRALFSFEFSSQQVTMAGRRSLVTYDDGDEWLPRATQPRRGRRHTRTDVRQLAPTKLYLKQVSHAIVSSHKF